MALLQTWQWVWKQGCGVQNTGSQLFEVKERVGNKIPQVLHRWNFIAVIASQSFLMTFLRLCRLATEQQVSFCSQFHLCGDLECHERQPKNKAYSYYFCLITTFLSTNKLIVRIEWRDCNQTTWRFFFYFNFLLLLLALQHRHLVWHSYLTSALSCKYQAGVVMSSHLFQHTTEPCSGHETFVQAENRKSVSSN